MRFQSIGSTRVQVHCQEHVALGSREHIMLNPGGQHQQMAGVKIMHLPLSRYLNVPFEQLDHHDTLGAVTGEAREMTEEIQGHGRRAVLIEGFLAVACLPRFGFLPESHRHFVEVIQVLRCRESLRRMLS